MGNPFGKPAVDAQVQQGAVAVRAEQGAVSATGLGLVQRHAAVAHGTVSAQGLCNARASAYGSAYGSATVQERAVVVDAQVQQHAIAPNAVNATMHREAITGNAEIHEHAVVGVQENAFKDAFKMTNTIDLAFLPVLTCFGALLSFTTMQILVLASPESLLGKLLFRLLDLLNLRPFENGLLPILAAVFFGVAVLFLYRRDKERQNEMAHLYKLQSTIVQELQMLQTQNIPLDCLNDLVWSKFVDAEASNQLKFKFERIGHAVFMHGRVLLGLPKGFSLTPENNKNEPQTIEVPEYKKLELDSALVKEIISAKYGGGETWRDCKEHVKNFLKAGKPVMVCNDNLGGDPKPGKKALKVTYMPKASYTFPICTIPPELAPAVDTALVLSVSPEGLSIRLFINSNGEVSLRNKNCSGDIWISVSWTMKR